MRILTERKQVLVTTRGRTTFRYNLCREYSRMTRGFRVLSSLNSKNFHRFPASLLVLMLKFVSFEPVLVVEAREIVLTVRS
jgi:hypothetical protein